MDGHELCLSVSGLGRVVGACEHGNETPGFVKCGEFFTN
jgi:hypothetical protein